MKQLLLALVLLTAAFAQRPAPTTVADITGDGSSHQLSTSTGQVRWVQFVALAANGAAIRIGDSSVSATRGTAVAPGGGFMLPPIPADPRDDYLRNFYNLNSIYYYAANGDKITVTYAQ